MDIFPTLTDRLSRALRSIRSQLEPPSQGSLLQDLLDPPGDALDAVAHALLHGLERHQDVAAQLLRGPRAEDGGVHLALPARARVFASAPDLGPRPAPLGHQASPTAPGP